MSKLAWSRLRFFCQLTSKKFNNYTIKKLSLTIISERVIIWLIYYYTIFALLHYLDYLSYLGYYYYLAYYLPPAIIYYFITII